MVEGPNQDKSTISCIYRRVLHTLKPEQTTPGTPMAGYRRQVGAFGDFASESSMDLDNMIFSTGLTFIFGSWIYEADDNDKLQSCLLEDLDHHEDLSISATTTDQLAERFA